MYIYLLSIFLLSYFSITYKENRIRKIEYVLLFIIFIAAFKFKVGTDWYHYQNFYEDIIPKIKLEYFLKSNIKFYFERYPFERAYGLLNYIFYNLGFNYEIFQGIIISLLLLKIFSFIKEKSSNYYYSILLLFMTSFFQYMFEPFFRQLIAVALFLIAIDYLEKNKKIKYVLIILLAICFHKSASILLLLPFIKNIRVNNKRMIFSLILMYIVVFNLEIIIKYIPFISSYSSYFDFSKTTKGHTTARNTKLLFDLIKISLAILKANLIFLSYRNSKKYSILIENMAIAFCILSVVALKIPIIERIQGYFIIPYVISNSNLTELKILKKYKLKFFNKLLMILFVLYTAVIFIKNISFNERNAFRYNNYKNYFFLTSEEKNLTKNEKRKQRDKFFYYWWELRPDK